MDMGLEGADTKKRILDAAQSLVQSIGANAMSYQHISEAVGIRKASIHHHFPTKEKLLDVLIDRYSEYFFGVVDGIIASRKNGRAKLRAYIALFESTLRESHQDKACPMGMLGAEVRTIGVGPADRVKQFFQRNDQRLAAILEDGLKDQSLQFEGSSAAMAGLVFALLEGAMLTARGRNDSEHFTTVTEQLLRMLKP
jgi:TetR/AcrR family transcriptional repressor of nem operon